MSSIRGRGRSRELLGEEARQVARCSRLARAVADSARSTAPFNAVAGELEARARRLPPRAAAELFGSRASARATILRASANRLGEAEAAAARLPPRAAGESGRRPGRAPGRGRPASASPETLRPAPPAAGDRGRRCARGRAVEDRRRWTRQAQSRHRQIGEGPDARRVPGADAESGGLAVAATAQAGRLPYRRWRRGRQIRPLRCGRRSRRSAVPRRLADARSR